MIMRAFATVLLLGSALVAGATFGHARVPALVLAVAMVATGVILSAVASSSVGPLAVTSGAVGALCAAWIAPNAPVIAGATLVSAVFLARAIRAGARRMQLLHVALSLIGGVAASACAVSYASSTLTAQVAAIVVSGVLASAALLVPVEDPLTFALDVATDSLSGSARVSVARATHLARITAEIGPSLPRPITRRLDRSLRAVLSLSASQVGVHATAGDLIERQMAAHVTGIERLLQVATEAGAREAGLRDEALVDLRDRGDQLAAQVSALAEVDEALSPTADREG
jgi:hypothetical protein